VTTINPASPTPAPCVGASPGPCALVHFHHKDLSLWPYPHARLDDSGRDDIVELDFADMSPLSDADAFEHRRQNGNSGPKVLKKVRAKGREEIERTWDVHGDIIANADASSPQTALEGHASGSAVSPSPQPGVPKLKGVHPTQYLLS